MSIVIVGITPKFAIGMCDGRVTDINNSILAEKFKKLIRINKYTCIGITGHMDLFRKLFEKINSTPYDSSNVKVDQLFHMIYNICKNIKETEIQIEDSSIVVFGINTSNEIESIGFSTKDFLINHQRTKNNEMSIQVLSNYPNSFHIARNNILSCGNLIKGMETTIKYIATVDKTVNSNIFVERIELQ